MIKHRAYLGRWAVMVLLIAGLLVPLAAGPDAQAGPAQQGPTPIRRAPGRLVSGGIITQSVPMGEVTAEVVIEEPVRDETDYPKLESQLEQLYESAVLGTGRELATFSGQRHIDLEAGTARVILEMYVDPEAHQAGPAWIETVDLGNGQTTTIEHAPPIAIRADLAAAIAAAGATYETAYEDWVQVLAPFDSLVALSEMPGVTRVRLPYPARTLEMPVVRGALGSVTAGGTPEVGTQTTEGVNLTNADAWHAVGLDGTGVNLAVFDFGFTNWDARVTEGNLPGGVVTHDLSVGYGYDFATDPTTYEHGTACAEIAYDMAPGSTLHLYAFETEVELGNGVANLGGYTGKKVASMSIGWVNAGPYDGSGPIDDIVNTAANTYGIFWANSAGNAQKTHYSWTSVQYSTGNTVAFGTGQIEGFGPTPGSLYNIPAGTSLSAYLEWNDWNAGRTGNVNHIDYDLCLARYYDPPGGNPLGWYGIGCTATRQCTTTDPPTESLGYTVATAGNYGLYIQRYVTGCTNNFGHWMQLHSFVSAGAQPLFWYINECNSLTIPADADGAVATGATFWNEDSTSPLYGLEPFSSLGPRNASGGGNPGTTVNKPDVVAPDGVSTAEYGASNGVRYADGGTGFWGTSGAAPHVAGLAATAWEGYPAYSLAQLRSHIQTESLCKGAGGTCGTNGACTAGSGQGFIQSDSMNNRFGWGRINLGNAPTAVKLTSFSAAPDPGGILVTWETATEHDNAGFNLYRSATVGDIGVRLNDLLIPSDTPGGDQGASYAFLDGAARPGVTYYYTLEDVDLSGHATPHGPVAVTPWWVYMPLVER